jgi:hypothetical protein
VPTTGEEILWAQQDLIKVLLPAYIYRRDWEKARLYYRAKLELLRRQRGLYEDKVEELEHRVSLLKAKVVDLENA